jgi:hypothetical protein
VEIVLKGEQITLLEKTPIFLSNFQIPVMQIRWTISATNFFKNLKKWNSNDNKSRWLPFILGIGPDKEGGLEY